MKKPRRKPIRVVVQRFLFAVSLLTAVSAGGVASWLVYDSSRPAEEVESAAVETRAPVDTDALNALALDPGYIYDRTPVSPSPTPVPTLSPTPASGGGGYVAPPRGPLVDSPYRLIIDRIGVNAPALAMGLTDGVPQIPYNGWQVAWYTFSAEPGTGNAVFAGHVTWNGVGVFYNLSSLGAGDIVRLSADNGVELTYTVTDSFIVDENDPNALAVMGPTGGDTVTLISCDGTFYPNGGFGGYTGRRIVRAARTS